MNKINNNYQTFIQQTINLMSKSKSIQDMYNLLTRKVDNGIQGYNLIHKYEDLNSKQSMSQRKVRELKRGSYLEDQDHVHRLVPGVGKYNISGDLKQKETTLKPKYGKKKTYLDEAMEKSKKEKYPAPGQYGILQSMAQQSLSRNFSNRKLKTDREEKITYLDNAQYEGTLTPGVGQYDVNKLQRSKTQATMKGIKRNPEYWIKHHKEEERRKISLIPKSPTMQSYRPIPSAYEIFDKKLEASKSGSYNKVGKVHHGERFKTEGMGKEALGPGKYNINNEWVPKEKNKKGILDSISKGTQKSVYYH